MTGGADAAVGELLAGVRAACLALPEVTERPSHGSPSWFVRGRRTLVSFADRHHGDPHTAIWAAAAPGVAAELVAEEPARFYVPPYVGHRGWVGLRLAGPEVDGVEVDWDEVGEVVADAFRVVAPRTLAAQLPAVPRPASGDAPPGAASSSGVSPRSSSASRRSCATIAGRAVM